MPAKWIDIGVNASTMEGYLTQPEGEGSHPAVVVIQEIWGVNSHIQSVVIARMRNSTDADILADVNAAMAYLKAQSFVVGDKIGIVGFCYGGRVSYLAACNVSDLAASVVFYGGGIGNALGDGPSPLEQTANIGCPMLGLFGVEDANPTPDDVAKMDSKLTTHGKAHEFHSYDGAGHGFHCETRASYRPEAAADAWGKAVAWFDQHLK